MKTEKIIVANLKCEGCETTIKNKLLKIKGVHSVVVNQEEDSVEIKCINQLEKINFTSALHELGYPEATEENGLLLQLKSYASCMLGRINEKIELITR